MLKADMHTHTRFSADGRNDMAEMCRAAIDKGLSHICFTDHIDNNPNDAGYNFFNYETYSDSIDRVRSEFGAQIEILKGIEFSEPHIYPREFEQVLKKDFDVIMVGIHYLGDTYVGDIVASGQFIKSQLFNRYYQEVMKAIKMGGFNVLAHFDLPKRYIKEDYEQTELTQEILGEMVMRGIALEVNTSPLRRGFHQSAPDFQILKQYVDLGGSTVTLGSDAHACGEVGADFDYAYNMIKKQNGNIGVFKKRHFVSLESCK